MRHADARLRLRAEGWKARSSGEWLQQRDAAQVACAPIRSREQVIERGRVGGNELIVESEHPHAGRMRQPRPAARFERSPFEQRLPAPTLGEHTDVVLSELGISSDELRELRNAGVVE